MALNITRGTVPKAQKIVVYGVEGIGKTTLASQFPRPLLIDTEGGSYHLDVPRVETPKSWEALLATVAAVKAERPCATLAIDTADWAERLCQQHVCAKGGKSSIEDWAYGKGYVMMAEEFGRLLDALTDLTEAGIHALLLAHSEVRKFEEPNEAGAYDRWELKLSKTGQKKIAPMVKEWADAVLFLNYVQVVENVAKDGQAPKYKARGGRRVIYATHHPCWDAKNRWGMPDESPLAWESLAPYVREIEAPAPAPAPAPQPAPATKNVAKPACQQNPLPKGAPAVAGPGQTVTFAADGAATVAPAAPEPASPPVAATVPPQWEQVAQLCASEGYTCGEVMAVAVQLKHFTADTPAESYPEDYLAFVASEWPKYKGHIDKMRADSEPVPF